MHLLSFIDKSAQSFDFNLNILFFFLNKMCQVLRNGIPCN